MAGPRRVLLIGYGNPGRLDDGLGPAVSRAVETWGLPNVTVETAFQLSVEDAARAAEHDVVVFADADAAMDGRFRLESCGRESAPGFSTHSVTPETVLALAAECFDARPRAYVLAVRGYEFDGFGERLSPRAKANLAEALAFLGPALRSDRIEEGRDEGP